MSISGTPVITGVSTLEDTLSISGNATVGNSFTCDKDLTVVGKTTAKNIDVGTVTGTVTGGFNS